MAETATTGQARPGLIRGRVRLIGWLALMAFALVIVVFLIWANTPRTAERAAADKVFDDPAVSVTNTATAVVLSPSAGASGVGLVFIPGARVDPYAYLFKLAGTVKDTGLTVVIAKPVLNLAILDLRPLDAFTVAAPRVETWLVGGHSLGGVRACMYADQPEVAGLVLFGSYCASPLTRPDLPVLSLTGSADALSTPEKIADTAGLLPADTEFVEIEGANHARFGDYGDEVGDGIATATTDAVAAAITRELSTFVADSISR